MSTIALIVAAGLSYFLTVTMCKMTIALVPLNCGVWGANKNQTRQRMSLTSNRMFFAVLVEWVPRRRSIIPSVTGIKTSHDNINNSSTGKKDRI